MLDIIHARALKIALHFLYTGNPFFLGKKIPRIKLKLTTLIYFATRQSSSIQTEACYLFLILAFEKTSDFAS